MWQYDKHSEKYRKNYEQLSGFVFQIFLQTRRSPESCKVDGQGKKNKASKVERILMESHGISWILHASHTCYVLPYPLARFLKTQCKPWKTASKEPLMAGQFHSLGPAL
jgi:hypothetical protein